MSTPDRIRVLLADDHRMVREALKGVLEPHCEIVAEAQNGEEAVALATRLKPHVVVLDIGMPGAGGLAAAYHLARRAPSSRVLVLSQYEDEEYVLEAFARARLAGYIVKHDAASELLEAVRAVHAAKRYVSPSIAPIVLARLGRGADGSFGAQPLSPREREVLKLVADGATSKEIAVRLQISPKTAQAHRENLKQKLNVRSTAEMVRWAIKHKVVRVE